MKDIFATVGKIGGLIFAAAVIMFTSWLTLALAGRLIPDNTILQFMTLVLFDIAAFIWFIQFITQAKGTVQWAVAGIGFGVGLVGSIIMAGGELILGQQLVALEDPSKLGWVLVATVIIAALAHAVLTYLFHFVDPGVKNRIENAQQVSKAVEKAYRDTRGEIERNSDELTASLRASVMFEAQQEIARATAAHIRGAGMLAQRAGETMRGAVVIPGDARDVPQAAGILTDTQTPASSPRRMWWQPRKDKKAEAAPVEQNPAPAIDPGLLAAITAALAQTMQPTGTPAKFASDTDWHYHPTPCPACGEPVQGDTCPKCGHKMGGTRPNVDLGKVQP